MEQENNNIREEEKESTFDISEYLSACLSRWRWFLLSVLVICSLATVWVLRKEPVYELSEQVLIQKESNSGNAVTAAFSSMGFGGMNSTVYNELIAFQSPAIMAQVVGKLNLQNNYTLRKLPHDVTLYGSNLPFHVSFPDLGPEKTVSFRMDVRPDGSARLYKFCKYENNKKIKLDGELNVKAGYSTVRTPIGPVVFAANPAYQPNPVDPEAGKTRSIDIRRNSFSGTLENYSKKLKGTLTDKDADVIDLTIQDTSRERADDILTAIIDVYSADYLRNKNELAVSTSKFIDERLSLIESDLGSVDESLSDYKQATMMPNLGAATEVNIKASSELDNQIIGANNRLAMAQFVRDYLVNPANRDNVIPVNTGFESPQLSSQISSYNSLLLARNNMVASTSVNNPLVKDYDAQLKGQREAIMTAVNQQVASSARALRNLEGYQGRLQGSLRQAPRQQKDMSAIYRQQKVKESLYIYLLQKREENELSKQFTASNLRIITPPMGSPRPVAPRKVFIVGCAFLFALILPAGMVYVMITMDKKVRSRKDIEKLKAPFAGEIPLSGKKQKFTRIRKWISDRSGKSGHKDNEEMKLLVQPGKRDVINESFRIVRSNIDFMMQGNGKSNVVMVTSFNPGSGKSFVTANLAASYAVKGKRVLVIDCDLRHGSSSQFVGMPSKGISNYLSGATNDWKSLVVCVNGDRNFSILPIGHRPPNPAELLDNGRFGELIKEASADYDLVLLDCPPLDVVVDTQILQKYAGCTVFVIRAGLFDKRAIRDLDEIYVSQRLRGMSVLLNGVEKKESRYGSYGGDYYSTKF